MLLSGNARGRTWSPYFTVSRLGVSMLEDGVIALYLSLEVRRPGFKPNRGQPYTPVRGAPYLK